MRIREATANDLPQVQALLVTTWHATYDAIMGADKVAAICAEWHSLANIARQLAASPASRLVACEEAQVVGTASIGRNDDGDVTLQQLYVLPAYQARGIGHALLAHVIEGCPDASQVSLEVEPQNERAIAFYERHGFARRGEVANCGCSTSGIRALVYVLDLSKEAVLEPGLLGGALKLGV